MMGTPDYSVVVRTLGTSGPAYRALLDSLQSQTVPPREVLVVLPEGRDLPAERLGTERFVRTRPGAVRQRSLGMRAAQGRFLLVCDDDVSFPEDLVEGLFRTQQLTGAGIVTPKVLSPGEPGLPSLKTSLGRIRDWFCGLNYDSTKPSPFHIRIWATGGYVRNARIEPGRQYYSQSGHGTCSFMTRQAAERLRFEDEMWLEGAPYPLPDDQVMFYKAYLQGDRIAWCQEAEVRHLDAGRGAPGRFEQMSYANGRNFTIFWHRFLFRTASGPARRLRLLAGLAFRMVNTCLLYAAVYLWNPGRSGAAMALYKGYFDAFRYLRTDEYRRLPEVR